METAGNKHVSNEYEQSKTNNNTNNNISNERPVRSKLGAFLAVRKKAL